MKVLILSLSILLSLPALALDGADDVNFDLKPAIGVGANTDGMYVGGKISLIHLGIPQDKISVKFLGIGYSVGEVEGLTFTPVIIKYKKIGVGLDFSLKHSNDAGLSVNYCF